MQTSTAKLSINLENEVQTQNLATNLATVIFDIPNQEPSKLISIINNLNQSIKGQIYLRGDLGAGKTCFTRAFLQACGVKGRIKSPSYTLVESYKVSNLYLYHFDFYRFSDAHEWRDAGFDELLAQDAISLIEWPEQAGGSLPAPDLDIHLEYAGDGRLATLTAQSTKGKKWLTLLQTKTR